MSEQEIIKHTKKAYTILKSSNISLKHKLTDILTEILIIVFAVSISIWLSNWSESVHNRKEEKEFLIGFKKDLQSEIENMTDCKEFYIKTLHGIKYFENAGKGAALNKDSIAEHSGVFLNYTNLDPSIGRYEGLKSSGKFRIIENRELLNNIIDLHETIIQRIQMLNEKYYLHIEKLKAVIVDNVQLAKDGNIINADEIINRNDIKVLLSTGEGLIRGNIIGIHDQGIKKCNEIIAQIDKELR